MNPIANLKDEIGLIFVGGNICTGKSTAANYAAAYIKKTSGMDAGPISMSDCLMQAYDFTENTPREKLTAVFGANPEKPWTAELVAESIRAEPGSIVVISGIRKASDTKYFFEQFPYSHFIALFADDQTLVDRIIRRNRPVDFPPGTPEEKKPVIAMQMLREEERAHGIGAMLAYVCKVPCKTKRELKDDISAPRGYVIDTSKKEGTSELEHGVQRALTEFGIS